MVRQWVRHFREGSASERDLLGGKGANLAEMTRIGLPVPPGFTVTTDAFRAVRAANGQPPDGLWIEIRDALTGVQRELDREFGNPACPLLISVRSGARDSMPGMMDTILNVGLNDATVEGLAALSGERFAWGAYRRLVQMYGRVVLGVDGASFERRLSAARRHEGVAHDHELSPNALRTLTGDFIRIVDDAGDPFPLDSWQQVQGAVMAVFRSWDTPRAIAYRRANDLSDDMGTAVTIQALSSATSATTAPPASPLLATRTPANGECSVNTCRTPRGRMSSPARARRSQSR
jgi:pyruvate, orthophosphate dikinase